VKSLNLPIVSLLGVALWAAQASPPASPGMVDFHKLVANYMKIRQTAASGVANLKTTDSPEKIRGHQSDLAAAIRSARSGAAQGDIFTGAITAEFRRIIRTSLSGPGAEHVRKSLKDTQPSPLPPITVNGAYPIDQPVPSMPPSLLQALPELPRGLEFRFVGRTLILRDGEANLIVDFMNEALP